MRAVTSPVNDRSVAFHEALGFEIERIDPAYDGVGEPRVLLVKRLAVTRSRDTGRRARSDHSEVGVPVYRGPFGAPQAERLLWRAGFGPRQGEAEALAKQGLDGAVARSSIPGPRRLVGPRPHDDKGRPLAPADAWGHDHCWWLDRMVRTSRPLVERMTLVWHDWFATSNDGVGNQELMLKQNDLFRFHAVGSFHRLLLDVTKDPAMLMWLNGTENVKGAPNENYAREMMELFTLGADRGAYTERDVREQARALTGWQNRWSRSKGDYDFHFDATRPRRGDEDRLPQVGPLRLAGRVPPLRLAPRARVVLRQQALELLRPGRAEPLDARRARGALQAGLRGRAGRQRDPQAPGPDRRAADGEAADRPPGRPAAPDRRRHHDDRLGLDRRASPGSSSSTRRTSPAGTTRAGSTPPRTAAAGSPCSGCCATTTSIPRSRRRDCRPTPTGCSRARSRSGGTRSSRPATHDALLHFAQASLHDASRQTGSTSSTRR